MPSSDQGLNRTRYMLVPRTLIFLTCAGHVLLLKGAAHKRLWAHRYNGIGGHIERGEDVLSAARRELEEETGLLAPQLWLCGVVTIDAGPEVGVGLYVLRGECEPGVGNDQELRTSEEGSLEWVPVEAVPELALVEDLPVLLPRVLDWKLGEPAFAAQYAYDADGALKICFG